MDELQLATTMNAWVWAARDVTGRENGVIKDLMSCFFRHKHGVKARVMVNEWIKPDKNISIIYNFSVTPSSKSQ